MKKKQVINKDMKEPDFLCSWDFCDSCINYRIRHHIKLDNLRSGGDGYSPYWRLKYPNRKPSQPAKYKN